MIEEGESIHIDIPARRLTVDVSEDELSRRKEHFKPLTKPASKAIRRYALLVGSADRGAVLADDI